MLHRYRYVHQIPRFQCIPLNVDLLASLYSYLAFVHLRANRDKLEAHGVEVE